MGFFAFVCFALLLPVVQLNGQQKTNTCGMRQVKLCCWRNGHVFEATFVSTCCKLQMGLRFLQRPRIESGFCASPDKTAKKSGVCSPPTQAAEEAKEASKQASNQARRLWLGVLVGLRAMGH